MPIRRQAMAIALASAMLAGVIACGDAARSRREQVELRVSAAVSLTEALQKVATAFEARQGVHIALNLAGSNTLVAQILEGAPVDVFISADAAQMDRAESGQAIAAGSRVNLLTNRLVVIVPASRDASFEIVGPPDLSDARVGHVALGDPAAVPAGVYARQYLERVGLWSALQPKIVPLPHVRAVVTAVASGSADAGFVYQTDAAVAKDVRVAWTVPAPDAPPIVYPAAVIKTTTHPDEARAFLAFLRTPEAVAIFTAAGFGTPPAGSTH